MDAKTTYDYKYSTDVNEEILEIQKKYEAEESPLTEQDRLLAELRRIDRSTTRMASIVSLSLGLVAAFIVILGLSLAMAYSGSLLVVGILISVVGVAAALPAYPIYRKLVEKKKEENGPRIRELSERLTREG